MQSEEVQQGRTFVIRLEQGEVIHACIEEFARQKNITCAALLILGGAEKKSQLIVGPIDGQQRPVQALRHQLAEPHEIAGTGTLFPNENGQPILHMHVACGRQETAVTGCVRAGVLCWQVLEIVLFELLGSSGKRVFDAQLGFEFLQIGAMHGKEMSAD